MNLPYPAKLESNRTCETHSHFVSRSKNLRSRSLLRIICPLLYNEHRSVGYSINQEAYRHSLFHSFPPTHGIVTGHPQLPTLSTDGRIATAFRFPLSTRLARSRHAPVVARSMTQWLSRDSNLPGRILDIAKRRR